MHMEWAERVETRAHVRGGKGGGRGAPARGRAAFQSKWLALPAPNVHTRAAANLTLQAMTPAPPSASSAETNSAFKMPT